jgi:hypothetical protein
MVDSTATTGNLIKGGFVFLNNFGTDNTFIGRNAGNLTTSGSGRNTALGVSALKATTNGTSNTATGVDSLGLNTTGSFNTAVGDAALLNNTTGSDNTAVGVQALSNANGVDNAWNTAIGVGALQYNTNTGNTATGAWALQFNTSGALNTATGNIALGQNTTGYENVATGHNTLGQNTSGAQNTAVGRLALFLNSTGNGNSAFGYNALYNNTTGSDNTALGFHADVPYPSNLSNATAIGAYAVVDASNKIRLGNTAVTLVETSGKVVAAGGVEGDSGAGIGVFGASNTGTGVQGQASATSGNTIGVRGVSFSPNGIGVSGEATSIGVYGRGTPAGFFQGDVQVLGTVNAANVAGNGAGLPNLNATSLTNGIQVQPNATSPNIINGFSGNSVAAGSVGATIAGGGESTFGNTASLNFATIGGGAANSASEFSTVAGGFGNVAGSRSTTVAGGQGNTASGFFATVAGGTSNIASGAASFAAGNAANANADGCFVWSDFSTSGQTVCGAANRFMARASGGVIFFSSPDQTHGVWLMPGSGSWSSLSDRNVKEHFGTVDAREVLARVAHLPIQTWNYKAQDPSIRHIGPMAQDFYAAFNVGEDATHITTIDEGGVALAAIQGLYTLVRQQQKVLEEQQAEIAVLKTHLGTSTQFNTAGNRQQEREP